MINLIKIFGILTCFLFIILIFITKRNRNVFYVEYIILSLPLLNIDIINNINGFVFISILFFIFFYRKNISISKDIQFLNFNILILLISVSIGLIVSEYAINQINIIEILKLLCLIQFCKVLIEESIKDPIIIEKLFSNLKTLLIVSFFFLFMQLIIGPGFSISNLQNPNINSSDGIRYPSFFSDPQVYAQYLGVNVFISLISLNKSSNYEKYKNRALAFLCCVSILLTGGRAGIIGILIAFIFYFLFIQFKMKIKFLILIALLISLVFITKDYFILFKRSTDMDEAYAFRNSVWQDALNIFYKNPFWGIGIGNYEKFAFFHLPNQVWLRENEIIVFDHPESGYLKILDELGGVGFISFFSLYFIPIIITIKNYFKSKDLNFILINAGIIVWIIGFYSTYSFGDIRMFVFLNTIICLLYLKLKTMYQFENINNYKMKNIIAI